MGSEKAENRIFLTKSGTLGAVSGLSVLAPNLAVSDAPRDALDVLYFFQIFPKLSFKIPVSVEI